MAGLDRHTVYMPNGDTGKLKMPVLLWGNGACNADGTSTAAFLQNVASYGYMAIALGNPGGAGGGGTDSGMLTQAIDWVTKVAGTGAYAKVDPTKIMAAGFSCGGVQAMSLSWDSRVASIGIFSSGLLDNFTAPSTWTKPTLYVLGGQADIAYNNVSVPRLLLSASCRTGC